MYFSQTGNSIECLISGKTWDFPTAGTPEYSTRKAAIVNAAKDWQATVLSEVFKVMAPKRAGEQVRRPMIEAHFYTIEQLQAAFALL